jgi:hypothetical protein
MQLSDEEKRTALAALIPDHHWRKWMAILLFLAGLSGVAGSGWNLFFNAVAAHTQTDRALFAAACGLAMTAGMLFEREREAGNLRGLVRRLLDEVQKGAASLAGTPSIGRMGEPAAAPDRPRDGGSTDITAPSA